MNEKEEWEIGYSRENIPFTISAEESDFNNTNPYTLAGQILDGRFLIEKNLTEGGADAGGIGLVYLAQDLNLLGKQVVVKILQRSVLDNENIVRKFQHEKEALIRLDHPNIVRILDSGTLSDGNPFMVMEFIEGYSLRRKLLHQKSLSLSECAHLIEKLGNALGMVHYKKILHRDLKPANIMLSPQDDGYDRLRLIDFGIARVENSQLAAETVVPQAIGTMLYMAPEQIEERLEQTSATDIYAFATIAYEMLTGERPFNPTSAVEMYMMQRKGVEILPSQIRSEIPSEVDQIILEALAFDHLARPQDAKQFARRLSASLKFPQKTSQENIIYAATSSNFDNKPVTAQSAYTFSASPLIETFPPAPTLLPPIVDNRIPHIENDGSDGKSKTSIYIGLGILILVAFGALIGFMFWKKSPPLMATNQSTNSEIPKITNVEKSVPLPKRTIIFYLDVQKVRDGKPFEIPFRSSGQEIFENGYKFKMTAASDSEGFIYLFNEDKDPLERPVYNILYPTPKTNNGSAQISAMQEIKTGFNTFSGATGTEIIWLIWTQAKQDELEFAKQSAFNNQGKLSESANVKNLEGFLDKHKDQKNEASKDTANKLTSIKGKGNTLVQRIELEHR